MAIFHHDILHRGLRRHSRVGEFSNSGAKGCAHKSSHGVHCTIFPSKAIVVGGFDLFLLLIPFSHCRFYSSRYRSVDRTARHLTARQKFINLWLWLSRHGWESPGLGCCLLSYSRRGGMFGERRVVIIPQVLKTLSLY